MRVMRAALWMTTSVLISASTMIQDAAAAPNDWAEGVADANDGATRDYYNRGALLPWHQQLGDWRDSAGALHGSGAFASTQVDDTDTARSIEWDATALVQQWVAGTIANEGFFLHAPSGGGPIVFSSREHGTASQHPVLEVVTSTGTQTLDPVADTFMEPSTFQDMGNGDELRVSSNNNALLRFDLSGVAGATVTSATLRLYTTAQYGSANIGLFRVSAGRDGPAPALEPGFAADFDDDVGVDGHADVLLFEDFESDSWEDNWTTTSGQFETLDSDPALQFEALSGSALRVLMPSGGNHALSLRYGFADKVGSEPSEIYFRYYLRFADDWNQTVDGGKMPGIAGTYGIAGWGGRPSDGTDGWSARGSYKLTIPDGNPLGGYTPLGSYVYHADMAGQYGDGFIWNQGWGPEGYGGILPRNQWYCIEQYLSMNAPSANDGVLRAWVDGRLAFEKTDFSFRTVDTLLIEEIWMNIYHGGTAVSPYDQHLYIDNVVIATSYIGPMGPIVIEPPDGGTDGGAGGGVGDDGGTPPPGDDAGSSGGGSAGSPDDDSGCGCALPGRSRTAAPIALLLAILVLRRRRGITWNRQVR